MSIKLLLDTLSSLGYEIIPMPNDIFAFLITGILSDNKKKDCLSGIIYDLDESKKLIYTYDVRVHANFTDEYLKQINETNESISGKIKVMNTMPPIKYNAFDKCASFLLKEKI